jgi:hypothetical protein
MRGGVFDNIFIERLWRTVKYEDISLRDYVTGVEADRRNNVIIHNGGPGLSLKEVALFLGVLVTLSPRDSDRV